MASDRSEFRLVNARGFGPVRADSQEEAERMREMFDEHEPRWAPHRVQQRQWMDVPSPVASSRTEHSS